DTAEPLDSLSQALITIFKESFPLVRQHVQNMQQRDAESIQLDNAYLAAADLEQAWMPLTYLRQAYLRQANLSGADLSGANLSEANLSRAYLSRADLSGADLSRADLSGADLSGAKGLTQSQLEVYKSKGAII